MKIASSLLMCLGLFAAACLPTARADEWNKKTNVTFSQPIEIPGKVLPAGTYTFKLLDSKSNRDIVEIYNADETKLEATLLAVPDYRLQPKGDTVLKFDERAAGSPEALQAWFYPGDNFGMEFVYPKQRASDLAKANKKQVLSMPDEMTSNLSKPTKSANDSHVMALKNAQVKGTQPTGGEIEVIEIITRHR